MHGFLLDPIATKSNIPLASFKIIVKIYIVMVDRDKKIIFHCDERLSI